MTEKEFHKLCSETETGTALSFYNGNNHVYGRFVGCSEDSVVIEANGLNFIWPRDLVDYRKSDYSTPSYS